MPKHEDKPGKSMSVPDHSHPPMRQPITQTKGGSLSGSGTKTNEPKG